MSIRFKLLMEFSGRNNGWTDTTADLHQRSGMDGGGGIRGNGIQDRVGSTGVLTLNLINSDHNSAGLQGYYTIGHANQRSGFKNGIGIRVSITIGVTDYVLYTGEITKINPTPGVKLTRLTRVTAVDYMDKCARTPVRGLNVEQAMTEHDAFDAIVDIMTVQPRARATGVGFDTFDFVFDATREEQDRVLTELQRLGQSSLANIYVKGDGTLVYEPRTIRATPGDPVIFITEADLRNMAPATVDDNTIALINKIETIVAPRRQESAAVVLYELSQPQGFPTGGPFQLKGLFTDPAQRALRAGGLNLVPAVAPTDLEFNAQADGLGTDVTAQVSVSTTFTGNAVLFGITNNSGDTAYAIKLQARGEGVTQVEAVTLEAKDDDLIGELGEQTQSLEMPYQSDIVVAQEVAQWLLHLLSQERKEVTAVPLFLDPTDEARAALIANRQIGDRFAITEEMTGLIAREFFINAIDFRMDGDGLAWVVWEPAAADETNFWYLEQVGFSELGQTTRLGFGYVVGHTDVAHSDSHGDDAHADTAHTDTHVDTHDDAAHGDAAHTDTAYVDTPHQDTHTDTAHGDVAHVDTLHSDSHTDTAHGDVAHDDVAHTDSHADTAHTDTHTDTAHDDTAHEDTPPHTDGEDVVEHGDEHGDTEYVDTHTDTAHSDSHSDVTHGDSHTDDAHGDTHNDVAHVDTHTDTPHTDTHTDVDHVDTAHADAGHTDSVHEDVAHVDTHGDVIHVDTAHVDEHGDTAHGDAN